MIQDHLAGIIKKHLKDEPTGAQEHLIDSLIVFTLNKSEDALFLLKGFAGTGKTTIISAFVEVLSELKLKFVLLAPTGRAAKVLTSYSGKDALTIHKKIYRQKSSKDGFGKFVLDKNLHTHTIFIVDESSMIPNQNQDSAIFGSGYLLNDLIEYVYNGKNCKLVIAGDTAQLPPVGLAVSPALNKEVLKMFSDTLYEEFLDEVVRQKQESGILQNATFLRQKIERNDISLPVFQVSGFDDVQKIQGAELLEMIASCYDKYGVNDTIIINRSNKRANRYNQGIRNMIFGREEELVPGDLLMVVRNNYFWANEEEDMSFIANGDIIEIMRIRKYVDLYGYRFVDCTIRLIDYNKEIDARLMLDTLHEEGPALSASKSKELFYTILEDYKEIKPKKKQYQSVKENVCFNALQVKYAYAITCHKSQGGQWKVVFLDQGYLARESMDKEYYRWLYTAFTRATKKIFLVNFPDFLFAG